MLSQKDVGWHLDYVCTIGESFVQMLTKALWYLDPHHSKFESRHIHIPDTFKMFSGYNDYKRKKEKAPQLSADELDYHIQQLGGMVLQPWMSSDLFLSLKSEVENLVEAMRKYYQYLVDKNSVMTLHHHSMESSQTLENASVKVISATISQLSDYVELDEKLQLLKLYEPLFINDFMPLDQYMKRKWVKNIAFSYPVCMYCYAYGNNLGTLTYLWKIPEGDVDQSVTSRLFAQLSFEQKKYSTRAIRNEFMDKYTRLVKVPKYILRSMYKTLVNDGSCEAENDIDCRVSRALIDLDDPDIILDMRQLNGNARNTQFDAFWNELQLYLDSINLAVDERRHGDVLHLPIAVSLRHLQELIKEKLKEKYPESCPPTPSLEWLRLQFWPNNQYSMSALKYTGKFKVKYGVQVRQLRRDHQDSHYVSVLLQYVRAFAVQYKSNLIFVSVDDKAVIPVGEPDCPVATGVRGHNHSLVPLDGPQLVALDHDFHINGIVPSVAFVVDVPENHSDSFFNGHAYVTLKDKVTQPSSALRHASELTQLVQSHCDQKKSIMILVSDGGPDHRVTFGSVRVASLGLFRALDLDMLICVQTCPYQSWQNLAERVMATLNFALQNVSLSRSKMSEQLEKLVKNKNTLQDIRTLITNNPEVGDGLVDSMSPVKVTLAQRFQIMKIKDIPVKIGTAATDDEMDKLFSFAQFIEPTLEKDRLTSKDLKKATTYTDFIKKHCHCSQYVFQIKKCLDSSCYYCVQHPVQVSPEVFDSLSFLPLPLLNATKDKYLKFDEVIGKPLSEKDRPSYVPKPSDEAKEIDKNNRKLLVKAKVRAVIECTNCFKPRCVYSISKLSAEEVIAVNRMKESRFYSCGSALFPQDSPLISSVVVKEAVTCACPMELQYYNAVLTHFPQVCYYCATEQCLLDDETTLDLRKNYAVVLPLCFICKAGGKTHFCKLPSKVGKPPAKKKTRLA